MRKRRRASDYKFTEKTHSLRGITGLGIGAVSLLIGIILVIISYRSKGNSNVYIGSFGVLAMMLSVVAFVLSVLSLREEDSYRVFPVAAMICSSISLVGWIGVYLAGILGI